MFPTRQIRESFLANGPPIAGRHGVVIEHGLERSDGTRILVAAAAEAKDRPETDADIRIAQGVDQHGDRFAGSDVGERFSRFLTRGLGLCGVAEAASQGSGSHAAARCSHPTERPGGRFATVRAGITIERCDQRLY